MKFSYLIISISLITPMLNHPITLGSILIFQTIMLCSNLNMYLETSWYSYILFITIIGGMMIMFMYMASIASNEKFNVNKLMIYIIIISMLLMMMTELLDHTTEYISKLEEKKENSLFQQELKTTMKFFNMNKMLLTILMIMTLLMTMVAVTNISGNFEGPLKKTYV